MALNNLIIDKFVLEKRQNGTIARFIVEKLLLL